MSDLRNHLFETLEQLKDADNPMELDRAKLVSDVAQNLIESAKVEVQFLKVIGAEKDTTGFFGRIEEDAQSKLPAPKPRVLRVGE